MHPTQGELNDAINAYIAGRMEEACRRLERLAPRLEGEDQSIAYLYLGRSYLAMGDLEKATDAFILGKERGAQSPFDEYLLKIRELSRSSIEAIAGESSVTRAQLACLLTRILPDSSREVLHAVSEPLDIRDHWARKYILSTLRNRYMRCLPDSLFHPDEGVTRSSLFVIMSRIAKSLQGTERDEFRWLIEEAKEPGGTRSYSDRTGAMLSIASGADVSRALRLVGRRDGGLN